MGLFDDWKKVLIIALVAILGISLLTNQVYFSIFMILVTIAGIIIFLYMQKREKPAKPLEVLKEELMFRAYDKSTKLGKLWLAGGSSSILADTNGKRYYGKRMLGKIRGYTVVHINPDKLKPRLSSGENVTRSPWSRLTIFRYTPRTPGIGGAIKYYLFRLPILKMFRKDQLFMVNDAQLGENSLTQGDIVLLGTATDFIAIMNTLATPDLDKDITYDYLGDEAKRLTLESILNDLPTIVDESIASSPMHQKLIEMYHGKAEDFGIKRSG